MTWYVITCPDHGKVITCDCADAVAVRAGAHDAPRHRAGAVIACPRCEVTSGPYGSTGEAQLLADRHDVIHHNGRSTAQVSDTTVCESCRRKPATMTWERQDASVPFSLCAACYPDPSTIAAARP